MWVRRSFSCLCSLWCVSVLASAERVEGDAMTIEQRYHRRLARKYGQMVDGIIRSNGNSCLIRWCRFDADYRGKDSLYGYAKDAAWHAFMAHPELRPEGSR